MGVLSVFSFLIFSSVDMSQQMMSLNQWNTTMKSGNEIEKRGASQYYLLHFGMPGSGARAPAQQKTRSYKRTNENGRRQYRSYRQRAQRSFRPFRSSRRF